MPARRTPRPPKGSRADRAWRDFAAWCERHRLNSLPAHPWTVAAYLRWSEHRRPLRRIEGDLAAIARIHVLNGHHPPDRHPTVLRTLRTIAARAEMRGAGAALFDHAILGIGDRRPAAKTKPAPRRRTLRMTPRLVARRGRG